MTRAQWLNLRFARFGLHEIFRTGVGYGLGPTAQSSVPEVRYDLDESSLVGLGMGWNDPGTWLALRRTFQPTDDQLGAAYAWLYDSAPTGPDGGRVRLRNSQPNVRL